MIILTMYFEHASGDDIGLDDELFSNRVSAVIGDLVIVPDMVSAISDTDKEESDYGQVVQ
jgi:hypothetical protein